MQVKNALVVDDSKLALFVLKKMLLEMGLTVDTCQSAEEGLDYLEDNSPDIIFLDHNMPGMNGLQALEIIKNNPQTATIPVMMYTSKDDETYSTQARALGAIDILPKQLKPKQLRNVLDTMHILNAVNDEVIHDAISEDNALSQLAHDAESILEKEALKQTIHQHFTHIENELQTIKESIAATAWQQEDNENRPSAFNIPIFIIILSCFIALFYLGWLTHTRTHLLEKKFDLVAESQSATSINISEAAGLQGDEERSNKEDSVSIDGLLDALVQATNNKKGTPFERPLITDAIIRHILEWLLPLNAARYEGALEIGIYTGRFCVSSNKKGEFILPPEKTPFSKCQVREYSIENERKTYEDILKLAEEVNSDPNNSFNIIVLAPQSEKTITHYPNIDSELTAGEWNRAAKTNHRIEYSFR